MPRCPYCGLLMTTRQARMPAATGRAMSEIRQGSKDSANVLWRSCVDDVPSVSPLQEWGGIALSITLVRTERCLRRGRRPRRRKWRQAAALHINSRADAVARTSRSVLASSQVEPSLPLLASQAPHPAVAGFAHFAEFGGALSRCGIVEDDR
jgi:hypothetical protein